MMRRETLNPMPDPSALVVKKGVKMFSVTAAGMAFPLSVTSMRMFSPSSMRARTSMRASGCAATASRAFLSRLTTTCETSPSSA